MKQVSDHTGKYLHNLGDINPDEDTLLKIIDNVPSSLSYQDEDGWLPIYTASQSKESLQCVPLLAKEGVKHNVGGDDARGGLLGEINVLEDFAHGGDDIIDAPSYHVLMDLAYNTWVTAVELMTHYTSMS